MNNWTTENTEVFDQFNRLEVYFRHVVRISCMVPPDVPAADRLSEAKLLGAVINYYGDRALDKVEFSKEWNDEDELFMKIATVDLSKVWEEEEWEEH
ncbi:hypothetical protein [Actinopolyspora erythraea]|uniref:hypothetical protein n=1 Tax=Actinopolyspora erythraea TaxID=414996 RepID=UPI00118681D6|nr:hypothetical protein [Actinopolyspora erythraea]